jgi:enoyl-CoA hydratase/carnithine racemase
MTGADNDVLYRVEDGIATVTINRPAQRNALSVAVGNRLTWLWQEIDRDPDVRVAVLTSADCGTFCAGMDLKEAAAIAAEGRGDILSRFDDPFQERMRHVAKPIVAAITGHFMAGGMMLALNADIRVALAGITAGITEAKVGRGSPWAVPLLWMLPQPLLMEMTMTGDLIPIERLHAVGFINHLEPTPDAVRARAMKIAACIRDNAPLSVRAAKASLLRAMSVGCEDGLVQAKRIYEAVYGSEDAQEGPRAFAEKRPPIWRGR